MSGTNFKSGVATREKYSGLTGTPNKKLKASTKFLNKTAVIHVDNPTAGDATEVTTDFTFPATAICRNVFLYVYTVDATETVSVGTAGTTNDPDGFLATASVATAGVVNPSLEVATQTRGRLITDEVAGATTYVPAFHAGVGGDPVTWTGSAGLDTAVFDIIIEYTEVVTEVN